MTDEYYMKRALRLARRGAGWVSPNPMVGSVIVKEGQIIGEGFHRRLGGPHGEIEAMKRAWAPVQGATIYVTLEPCSHYGKTPPCVDALIAAGPARVVVGTVDPNPLVSGRGIEALQRAGIETKVGVLAGECRELNEVFFKFMTTGLPFVTVKFAQTLDGRIASSTGDSRWISSSPSRRFAHRLRSLHDAILVGLGTVRRDDAELTVRLVRGRNPLRIVLDSHLFIPEKAKVLTTQDSARTIIATTSPSDREKRAKLEAAGIEILTIDADDGGHVDLKKLLVELGKRQVSSLFVEGGSETITSFLKGKLADRVVIFVAPKILGKGTDAVGDLGKQRIDEAQRFVFRKVSRIGEDILIDVRPLQD